MNRPKNGGGIARRTTGVVAAMVAAAVTVGVWVWLGWPPGDPGGLATAAWAFGLVGLPFTLAASAVAWHAARATHGRDNPERLLVVATAGRRGRRGEWGAAMRAELASIADPGERRQFAFGCVLTALRTGWGRGPLVVGSVAFVVFAAATFAGSRVMLAGARTGILAGVLLSVLVSFAVGLVAARAGQSFRAGLETGVVAMLAGLAGMVAVTVPEAIAWYHQAGVWFVDGDRPVGGIAGPGAAVRDAVGGVTMFYLLFNVPWPVLGAAVGVWRRPARELPLLRARG